MGRVAFRRWAVFVATFALLLLSVTGASAEEEPLRVRTARIRLVGGAWDLVPGHSSLERIDDGRFRLRRPNPPARLPDVGIGYAPPGTRGRVRPEPAIVVTEFLLGTRTPRGTIEISGVREIRPETAVERWSEGMHRPMHEVPVGRVFTPILRLLVRTTPSPLRNERTLARIEPDDGVVREWTLADWQTALADDAKRLASAAAGFRGTYPPDEAARRFATEERAALFDLGWTAAALPLPAAVPHLRAIEETLAAEPALSSRAGLFRLGRVLAGDETVLARPDWGEWARAVESTDLRHATKIGGQFWARTAMVTPSAVVRDEAWRLLSESEVSAKVAGDVLESVRWGRVDPPAAVRARLDAGPTEDRTRIAAMVRHPGWAALAALLVLAGLAGIVREGAGLASSVEGAMVATIGLTLLSLTLVADGEDLAPDLLGYVFLATGLRRALAPPGVRPIPLVGLLLAVAVCAEVAARFVPAPAVMREVACLAAAGGFLAAVRVARAASGRGLPLAFVAFWAVPVALFHGAEIAALAGAPVSLPLQGPPAILFAAVATLGALGGLRSVFDAAAGNDLNRARA